MARRVWKRKKGKSLNAQMKPHPYKSEGVECYFRNLEDELVQFATESPAIVMCMAWMTSRKIMEVLSQKSCVLILQNESWLNKAGGLAKKTREKYKNLRDSKEKFQAGRRNLKKDIRVVGLISHPQNMHHKFAVRLSEDGTPLSVWTGSFNPTTNGNESIENAVVIHDEGAASAYLEEFLQVLALSKPLKV